MRVSGWIVAGAGALTAVVVTGVIVGLDMWKTRQARLDAERAQRQAPVTEIAPAPLPTGLPLLGSDGWDADGYPTRYVDRAALRSLLWHRRYSDLTRYFEEFQSEFEADARKEYWPSDAAEAFYSAEPDLDPALDAWVAATSNSFAPYLARGSHWVSVAYARRGTTFAHKTVPEHFLAMKRALKQGLTDLDRALELRPRLIAAMRLKIIAFFGDLKELRRTVNQAIVVCPSCFEVRAAYISALTPRWGGSYEAMLEFARDRVDPSNPRLRLLPAYILLDKADLLLADKEPRQALATIQLAFAFGEHWRFLYDRAEVRAYLDYPGWAIGDLDRALALRPGHPRVLFKRAYMYHGSSRWEAAGRDFLAGIRVSPTDDEARRIFDTIVQGLIYEGWEYHKAGHPEDALRVYDLAAEIAPANQEVRSRRAFIVMGRSASEGVDMAALEERARNSPDDFRALQQLDYALEHQGHFPRIVEMWTAYLARHPNDGVAYLERGGAYFRMGRLEESYADAYRACGLGNSEGCWRAKQVRAMLQN